MLFQEIIEIDTFKFNLYQSNFLDKIKENKACNCLGNYNWYVYSFHIIFTYSCNVVNRIPKKAQDTNKVDNHATSYLLVEMIMIFE
jgi:hypothetical protein